MPLRARSSFPSLNRGDSCCASFRLYPQPASVCLQIPSHIPTSCPHSPIPHSSFLPASFSPGKSTRLDTSKSEVQQRHSFAASASASALPHFQPSPRHFILIPFCVGIYFHSIPRHFPATSACRFMLFIPYAKYAELWGITKRLPVTRMASSRVKWDRPWSCMAIWELILVNLLLLLIYRMQEE